MFTYEYSCPDCKDFTWEEIRQMHQRNLPATCPKCGKADCKKIMSATNINRLFAGSTLQSDLAERYTKLSEEAQSEGFTSKDELDTAIGLAQERAKQMGTPDKQLIGPVQSPFQGPGYTPTKEEVGTADTLVKAKLKAQMSGDEKKVRAATQGLKEHESSVKQKSAAHQRKFVPKHAKEAHSKQIKNSQEARRKHS